MNGTAVLTDAFGRVPELLRHALEGARPEQLTHRLDPRANTLAWLAWHTAREQDAQVARLAGTDEVWTSEGWAARADLRLPDEDMGYGHTPEQVALVDAPAELLLDYADAVHRSVVGYLERTSDDQLDAVVDERWDPPVTLGVRLVSVEHAGQAAFLRGLLDRA